MRYIAPLLAAGVLVLAFVVNFANAELGDNYGLVESSFDGTLDTDLDLDGHAIVDGSSSSITIPSDGEVLVCNNAGTECVCLSSDGGATSIHSGNCSTWASIKTYSLLIRDFADVGISLGSNNTLWHMSSVGHRFTLDDPNPYPDFALMDSYNSASDEFTASNGTQYGDRMRMYVDQSGTAGATLDDKDLITDGEGSGDYNLLVRRKDGTAKFTVDDGGEVNASGISGDGSGKAVCIKADGDLGTCADAVGAGGTCTCS